MTPRFKIGQKYIPVGDKNKAIHTVVDIHTTMNSAGEVVRLRYVSTHEFCGQMVTDYDVSDTRIARGVQS